MRAGARKAAQLVGATRYDTGQPCALGHIAERYTRNARCVECARGMRRAQYAANPEHSRELGRVSMAKWRKDNSAVERARTLAWQRANSGIVKAGKRRRRAALLNRTPVWFGDFDEFVIEQAYELTALRATATGANWHVDHMMPLLGKLVSGLHCALNIQVIPETLNRRKGNRLQLTAPGEWILHT